MKKLNGNLYFQKKDVKTTTEKLLFTLTEKEFIKKQTPRDRLLIENAIKSFSNDIISLLKTEMAVKFDFIEKLYTNTMHPAVDLIDPESFNKIPNKELCQLEQIKYENWFYNYGLSLIVAQFEDCV